MIFIDFYFQLVQLGAVPVQINHLYFLKELLVEYTFPVLLYRQHLIILVVVHFIYNNLELLHSKLL